MSPTKITLTFFWTVRKDLTWHAKLNVWQNCWIYFTYPSGKDPQKTFEKGMTLQKKKKKKDCDEAGQTFCLWLSKEINLGFFCFVFLMPVEPICNRLRPPLCLAIIQGTHHRPVVSCDAPRCPTQLLLKPLWTKVVHWEKSSVLFLGLLLM